MFHKTRPGRLLTVLRTFNLCPVSRSSEISIFVNFHKNFLHEHYWKFADFLLNPLNDCFSKKSFKPFFANTNTTDI